MALNQNMTGVTYNFAPRTAAPAVDPVGSLTNARNEAYGLARKAVNTSNPQDAAILAMLQQRAGPDGGPYDAATKAAMMAQASDTAGQIALNSKAKIHGSAGDPANVAANNEADARRFQAIQQAQTGINSQANIANYDARGQAIGQYGAFNQAVQNRATDNQRFLIDMLTHENRDAPNMGGGIPSFSQYAAGGAGGTSYDSGQQPPDWTKVPGAWSYKPQATIGGGQQNPVDYGAQTKGTAQWISPGNDAGSYQPTTTGWATPDGKATGGVPGNNAYQFYPPGTTSTVPKTKVLDPLRPSTWLQ